MSKIDPSLNNPLGSTAINPANRNYWVSRDEYPLASWYASFPDGPVEPRDYLTFLNEVLVEAEREEVLRVIQVSLDSSERQDYPEKYWDYCAQSTELSYIEYTEQAFADTGKIIALGQLEASGGSRPYGTTRLSYYETDGQVVETEVENMGSLLQRLYPNEVLERDSEEEWGNHEDYPYYKATGSAILFSGKLGTSKETWAMFRAWENLPESIREPDDQPYVSAAYLGIHLYTDIWFPRVKGFLERMESSTEYGDDYMFDNTELAQRHTPRLNRFLQSVKQLIKERGGDLAVDCSNFQDFYGSMCSDNGIILDA
ncbi:MAG: hypothetical protein ACFCU8_17210 [Thermosynechococcaceae cyanobacterium]